MADAPALDFRPMTVGDIDATGYIRKAAMEALDREQGREPPAWEPRTLPHFAHLLRTDPDGAWVVTLGGLAVGYAMGFTRGDVWFLAQLFVLPEAQGKGVGQKALELSMDAGRKRGARHFSVVASTSPVAQALYMRAGMFALGIGYRVRGPVDALLALPPAAGTPKLVVDCEGWDDRIAELDRDVWGGARTDDHRLYRQDVWGSESYSFAFNRDGQLAGYGYAMADGHIGPFAAREQGDVPALMRIAGEWLHERGAGEAYGYFLTTNPAALRPLLNAGWKTNGWTFFLATEPFGRFDRYVPGGGLLL
jgi:ribosomal protein S18 acetylase RimI-like enzyme